jgi:Heparinase II/III N-terminus/Heparinase II/III-like protein
MKNKLQIIKNMGVGWTLFRTKYEIEKKLGLIERKFKPIQIDNSEFIRKLKLKNVHDEESFSSFFKDNLTPFFFRPKEVIELKNILVEIRKEKNNDILKLADDICQNKFLYFSKWSVTFKEIDWHLNPVKQKKAPSNKHWINIPDLGKDFGDIKFIWELSRFPFVYALVRAYAVTGDSKYVRKFWELFESWVENNPLETGVNYKCGQEMSLRLMAWIFGLYAFLEHPETTPKRITTILKMIYYHTDHIDRHFEFALKSVRNNHTISEAAGMYTVGLLFPFFDKSKKWKEKGKKYLELEGLRQIYVDGSYLQHSMNYQRLVVQDYTWVLQLAKLNNDEFSEELRERVKKCVLFLYNNQDEYTGRLPNYGMNDGALIHPLASNDYLDYRPQLNAAWYVLTGNRLYERGLHDENLLWLCGVKSLGVPLNAPKRGSKEYSIGGYYTIRSQNSHGFIRCTSYKDRPYQADMLHFDLWWKGYNVLADAGTYSYNTEQKWQSYFNGTSSHNTVMIDNKDQMEKASRFIWLNWTKSKTLCFKQIGNINVFEGEHYGYLPLIHRRAVLNIEDNWIVIDDIFGDFGETNHNASLHWLIGTNEIETVSDDSWRLPVEKENLYIRVFCQSDFSKEIYRGSDNPIQGWQSLYYGEKKPVPQLKLSFNIKEKARIITAISLNLSDIDYHNKTDVLEVKGQRFVLQDIGSNSIFKFN